MHPLMIVMAVLGCADDATQCQLVHRVPTTYASVAACNKAAESELGRLSNLDFPTIMAQCQAEPEAVVAVATRPTSR